MSDRSNHGINLVEDATRKGSDANAGGGKLIKLIKVLALAASLTVAVRFLADRSSAQLPDNRGRSQKEQGYDRQISENAQQMMEQGKQIFRYDTFGSEDFWGGKLRLHEAIAGEKLGGVGSGVSPKAALALGLKVDAEALPTALELAKRLANGPTQALGMIRKLGWSALEQPFDRQIQLERESQFKAGKNPDFDEGVAAFKEKRPAKFTGGRV